MIHWGNVPFVPFAVAVPDFEAFFHYDKQNESAPVHYDRSGYLTIDDKRLSVIKYRQATDVRIAKDAAAYSLQKAFYHYLNLGGSSFQNHKYRELIEKLCSAGKSGSHENIRSLFNRLIGLGDGLTPSMDDVLTGFLAASNELDPEHVCIRNELSETAIELAPLLTNRISAAFITAAARSYRFECLYRILSGDISAVNGMFAFGASSGKEMLLGAFSAACSIGLINL